MTLNEIKALIESGETEHKNLDFKAAGALLDKEGNKLRLEISKDVSSFANSAGGKIIYGVEENPLRLDPFDPKRFSKERLEQIIINNIAPRIPDIRISAVAVADGKVLYVVEIPQGKTAHQAADKRYHRRYEGTTLAMEDYEIRDVMARASGIETELSLIADLTRSYSKNKGVEKYRPGRHFLVRVVNKGTRVSNWCLAEIYAGVHATRSEASGHFFTNEGEDTREVFTFSNAEKLIEEEQEEKIVPAAYPAPLLPHRHIENGLLDLLENLGVGCIGFSALAQGLLTNKYISGSASAGRAFEGESFRKDFLSEENLKNVRGLAAIAKKRGQTLAQMAIAWVLRDDRVTSALIGARNVDQLDDSLDALKKQEFSAEELGAIDEFAKEGGIDLWRETSEL
jgi:hypothetical protein